LIEKKYLLRIVSIIFLQGILLIFFYQDPLQRIYSHTKSQLFEESGHFVFLSERHELHYLTALRIFNSFPLIGAGANSFRQLCDKDPYSVKDIILKNPNNQILAKQDGYFYYIKNFKISENNQSDLIFIFNKQYFDQKNISSYNADAISKLIRNNIDNPYNVNDFYIFKSTGVFNKYNHKNFDFIKKNSPVFLNYEFLNGCNTHPHHFYIQLLAETGILGFFFLVIFYLFICKSLFVRVIKFIKNGIIYNDTIIYAYYFSLFSPLIPSGNFFNNYYNLFIYLPLTFIILCQRE
jgi:hypothetical protein